MSVTWFGSIKVSEKICRAVVAKVALCELDEWDELLETVLLRDELEWLELEECELLEWLLDECELLCELDE